MAVDSPFIEFKGEAAENDVERCIVDEGDQASEALEGWIMVEVDDEGDQIMDAKYFVPFYSLS